MGDCFDGCGYRNGAFQLFVFCKKCISDSCTSGDAKRIVFYQRLERIYIPFYSTADHVYSDRYGMSCKWNHTGAICRTMAGKCHGNRILSVFTCMSLRHVYRTAVCIACVFPGGKFSVGRDYCGSTLCAEFPWLWNQFQSDTGYPFVPYSFSD